MSTSPAAVQRAEILDYVTYEEQRAELRARALVAKGLRRYLVGEELMFLFENHETLRYQVLEMIRVEKLVKEADIQHELATYNELLGGPGELGCSLFVTIQDAEERDRKLTRWLDLPGRVYLRMADGRRVRARYDERQVGDTRLSSVQYMTFDVGGEAPIACGCDHAELRAEYPLSAAERAALTADLVAGAER